MPLSETILIIMGLLAIAMFAAGLCKNLPIPYTVFLVIIGIALGSIAKNWSQLSQLQQFQLSPELVLFLFLPALIFESAFNLDARQMVKDLASILSLAIPALLISTAIIGVGLWWLIDLNILLALLFGALISATDPVAVVALFKELGAPQRLTVLVEGESLLNDATAIVLFNIILGIVLTGSFVFTDIGGAMTGFLRVFFGGALLGAISGIILSELLYRIKAGLSTYLVMSIVLAYASFAVAEHVLHVSGVMAVLAAAICLSIFGVSRVPQSDVHTVTEIWEVLALVCNSLLFLLVGLSVDITALIARSDAIIIAVLLVLLSRAATVYTMVPTAVRLFKLPHISLNERHIMWWGGLKGGLAIAIVLSIPVTISGRDLLLDMTLGVVLFSLLVNAPTIRPLMHFLGIDRLSNDEKDELKHGLLNAEKQADIVLQKLNKAELISPSTQQLLQEKSKKVFASDHNNIDSQQETRHLISITLRSELDELKYLYDIGLIEQYSYLDIKNTLQRDRELRLGQQSQNLTIIKPSLFKQIEDALLKRLREHNWATGILVKYQYLRFSQSLQRDMVGVMISTAALESLQQQTKHNAQQLQVAAIYQKRLNRRRQRLNSVAKEYPEFYNRFETKLFAKVIMLAVQHYNESTRQHGEIGQKTFANIEHRIKNALSTLPAISHSSPKLTADDLIGTVPLLKGLSNTILKQLADKAKSITFLSNDIIIGEGDKGDALYIISHGWVKVYKKADDNKTIAELRDGDFFGEIALLGDQIRTATVKAIVPTTLLRLTRKDVLTLAKEQHELQERLEKASQDRF
jgi:Na+:H+ antiporter